MDSVEFAYWQAYDILNPFGIKRDDLRNAMTCHTIATTAGFKATYDQFIPTFGDVDKEDKDKIVPWQMSDVELEHSMRMYAMAYNQYHGYNSDGTVKTIA